MKFRGFSSLVGFRLLGEVDKRDVLDITIPDEDLSQVAEVMLRVLNGYVSPQLLDICRQTVEFADSQQKKD